MIMIVVVVSVVMMVMFMVMMVMIVRAVRLTPGAPQHPQRDGNNDYPGKQLKPGLGGLRVPAAAKPHACHCDDPHDHRVRQRRRQP